MLAVPGSVLAALHLEFYLTLPRTMGGTPTLAMISVLHCTPGSLRQNVTFVFVLYRKEVEGTVIGTGPLASGGPRPKSPLLSVTQVPGSLCLYFFTYKMGFERHFARSVSGFNLRVPKYKNIQSSV